MNEDELEDPRRTFKHGVLLLWLILGIVFIPVSITAFIIYSDLWLSVLFIIAYGMVAGTGTCLLKIVYNIYGDFYK